MDQIMERSPFIKPLSGFSSKKDSSKRDLCALWVRMQTGATAMETVWRFLKKLKIDLLYDLAIPFLGI